MRDITKILILAASLLTGSDAQRHDRAAQAKNGTEHNGLEQANLSPYTRNICLCSGSTAHLRATEPKQPYSSEPTTSASPKHTLTKTISKPWKGTSYIAVELDKSRRQNTASPAKLYSRRKYSDSHG